ncbi:MAG: competence/damage-inducible protein A [Ignavibacteria bacterium]|nr:competence/damage-inducible protein A [Ignavibacteria bacterium]
MTAEIISIGDELLIGQTVNTNASFLGEKLSAIGVRVARVTTVGDDRAAMLQAFERAWAEHDAVITTGGLGPTHDDITRAVVVDFFRTRLVFSRFVMQDIEAMFARLNRPVHAANRDQAMVPEAAAVIRNANGTAPGFHFADRGRHFFVTPGVPYEMQAMAESVIVPVLRASVTEHRAVVNLRSTGIPESVLAMRLDGIDAFLGDAALAYLPSPLGVTLRVSAIDTVPREAEKRRDAMKRFILDRVAEYVYGEDGVTLEQTVGTLLRGRGSTLAVAESCTGGLLANRITDVPGSSAYFERGAVTYSNASKTAMLGVDPAIIAAHGAVSRETAVALAIGARETAGTSFGLSTTGVAGPDGGSAEKPVGTVWIGLSAEGFADAWRYDFGTNRARTKLRATQAALDLLRRRLLGLPLHPSPQP